MFPLVILLYAWWKRGRIRGVDLKASAAFFAVSLVLGLVTVWFQQHHAIKGQDVAVGGWIAQLALAGSSMGFYLWQCICPRSLLPMYPKWTVDPPAPADFLPYVAVAAVLAIAWMKRATWGRHLLLGLGFFLLNLAPFVGFAAAFYMSFSWVLDHVLYVPLVGLAGLFAAWIEYLCGWMDAQSRVVVTVSVALYLAMLSLWSHQYAGKFTNQPTLWTYTLERNPEAWPAHNNVGNYLSSLGRVDEAMDHFRNVIRINPRIPAAYNNLGNGYQKLGRYSEAIEQYQIAISISPDYEQPHQAMALALGRMGKVFEAIEQYKLAVGINPNDTKTRLEFADLLLRAGRASEAAEQYEAALRNDPHYAPYREDLKKSSPAKH
jgi:tetratricopeptide (TPR) repeat protein